MLEDPQESQDDACRKLFKKGCLKKKRKKSECDNIEKTCQSKVKDVAEKLPPVENP